MDLQDWFKAQPTLAQAAITLVVVVGAIALLFVGSATVGDVLFGGEETPDVVAEADVSFDAGGDSITVTFVSAESGDTRLDVRLSEVENGGRETYRGQTSATLTSTGDQVRFDGQGMGDGDRFRVTVVAVNGDRTTTIATETDSL